MLIQALCDYYDTLSAQGKLVPEGYSAVKISYLISLTPEGNVDGIIQETRDNCLFPERDSTKTIIKSELLDERGAYIFGLEKPAKKKPLQSPEDLFYLHTKKFECYQKENLAFIEGIDSPVVNAFRNYLIRWKPQDALRDDRLMDCCGAKCAFFLTGRPDQLLQEDEQINIKWKKFLEINVLENLPEDAVVSQCGITGEISTIARLHNKVNGVVFGQHKQSAPLINVDSDFTAGASYGKKQGYNTNVSVLAMKKYTTALNYLLSTRDHSMDVNELTIVHWANDSNEIYDQTWNMLLSGGTETEKTDDRLKGLVHRLRTGRVTSDDVDEFLQELDNTVTFCITGLQATSKGRIAIKFIYRRQFGELFRNLVQHQLDLKISQQSRPISLNALTKELVSPKSSKQTVDTSLQVKILESILYGWRYPSFLLQTVVRRIQTDSDTEENRYIQMNDTRMGILKACINRDDRLSGREEEIKMALDKDNKTPAYLCGRLFAVLENIQQRASGYDLNRTIKDAYFTSASTRPALVFPKLLTLAQHHMRKMENDYYADLGIEEILSDLGNEFPTILSLKEQGVFMLGYYQQKHAIREQIKAYKEDK